MRLLDVVEHFIYRSKRSLFIGVALALSLVKTGIWYMPNLETSRVLSFDPFRNPFPDPLVHYMVWNWFSPFLAWRLRIHNERSFLYFHLLFSIAFTALFIAYVWSHFREQDARSAFVLFVALPVSTTAYYWIGMDSVTLFLMLLMVILRKHLWPAMLIGILLGMQHFEQGAVAFGALLFASLLSLIVKNELQYPVRLAIASLVGVILGKIILLLIFHHYGMHVNSGRLFLLRLARGTYIDEFLYNFQYILWSVCGVAWLAVAKYAERGKMAVPFLVTLAGQLFLLPLVDDETRVLSIVSFPIAAVFLLLNAGFLQSLSTRFVAAVFAIWTIVPYPWVWIGKPRVSVFPHDMAYLLHRVLGWFHVPSNMPPWPF